MIMRDQMRMMASGQPNILEGGRRTPSDIKDWRKLFLDAGKSRGEMWLLDRPYKRARDLPGPYKYDYEKDPRGFLLPSERTPQVTAQKPTAPAPQKAKPATPIQTKGRVPTVKRKRQSRGRTIMGPLAGKNEGSTYRKKLLGE